MSFVLRFRNATCNIGSKCYMCMCDLGVYTICCSVMFLFDLTKLIVERIATSRLSAGFCYLVKKQLLCLQYLILANRCGRVLNKSVSQNKIIVFITSMRKRWGRNVHMLFHWITTNRILEVITKQEKKHMGIYFFIRLV